MIPIHIANSSSFTFYLKFVPILLWRHPIKTLPFWFDMLLSTCKLVWSTFFQQWQTTSNTHLSYNIQDIVFSHDVLNSRATVELRKRSRWPLLVLHLHREPKEKNNTGRLPVSRSLKWLPNGWWKPHGTSPPGGFTNAVWYFFTNVSVEEANTPECIPFCLETYSQEQCLISWYFIEEQKMG